VNLDILTDENKKIIREIVENFSKSGIDLRDPNEKIEQILNKFRKKGEIADFLHKARYKELYGLLAIIVKKDKYDVVSVNINGKQKTKKNLRRELRKYFQEVKKS